MILGLSRFKVAHGMEREVREAVLERPHLLDAAPGFLGMETFTEENDGTAFYLLTRWTDAVSFRTWHSSLAHRESHRGVPKGLKLDPTFTKVFLLDRSRHAAFPPTSWEHVDDAGELIARVLADSEMLHFLISAPDGTITTCNPAVASALGTSSDKLVGTSLWECLANPDAISLRERMASGRRSPRERVALSFGSSDNKRFTVSCWIDVHPTHTVIIGTALQAHDGRDDTLYAMNNELAVLAREHARTSKELNAAKTKLQDTLDELNRSYWHLRKIAEVLPMCADCGKVQAADDEWQNVADYLREHSLFLSHGCCPDCVAKMRAELGL